MIQAKLLIVHHGALGDVVAAFPAILRLKQTFGCIDALFQSMLGKLAADLNVIDKWFALETAAFATLYTNSVAPAVKHLLNTYDCIILFSRSQRLQETVSKTTGKKIDLIPPVPDVDQKVHVSEHILVQLAQRGFINDAATDYNLILPSGLPRDKSKKMYTPAKILIHPGSGSRKKNWGAAHFIKTAEILASDGFQTEFVLGPADDYLTESLPAPQGHSSKVHLIDDLEKLVSLLTTAGGFVGNDSGVGHLAAFLGLPTLTVFGPSDPQRWRPMGRAVAFVRPQLECIPCFERNNIDCKKMECLDRTSPEMVVAAFHKLMEETF